MSEELLTTARRLARASAGKPRQADLRRSVSTAYYALFHALARDAADLLVGTDAARPEWVRVYRALDHGQARTACRIVRSGDGTLAPVAATFLALQDARHDADYDPVVRLDRSGALRLCDRAAEALADLRQASRPDRRTFAVALLFRERR